MIEAAGVGRVFPPHREALRDIQLTIATGELVALLGPSGCGKSTLLRLLAGLDHLSSGRLLVNVPPSAERLPGLSFMFQEATLLPWRTLLDNIALPLELAGWPRPARLERATAYAKLVGLGDALGLRPRQLSGGMKMRCSLARALASEPRLLLLDEPFGALDEITRDHLNEELLRLRDLHRWTGLCVTHNVGEAVFLASRILIMAPRPGRIAAEIAVPFAYPRTAELRAQLPFLELCAHVSARLREVAAPSPSREVRP